MVSNDPASSASEMECSSKTLNCNLPCTKSISIWSKASHVLHGEVFALLPVCIDPVEPEFAKQRWELQNAVLCHWFSSLSTKKITFARIIKQKGELICYRVAHVGAQLHFCFVCFCLICLCRERFHQISLWQIDQRQCASLFRANLGDRWPVAPFG